MKKKLNIELKEKTIFDLNLVVSVLALKFSIVGILGAFINFVLLNAYCVECIFVKNSNLKKIRIKIIIYSIYTIILFISARWHGGCMCSASTLYKVSIIVYTLVWLPFLIILRKKCLKAVSSEKKLSFKYLIFTIIIGFIAVNVCGFYIESAHNIYPC